MLAQRVFQTSEFSMPADPSTVIFVPFHFCGLSSDRLAYYMTCPVLMEWASDLFQFRCDCTAEWLSLSEVSGTKNAVIACFWFAVKFALGASRGGNATKAHVQEGKRFLSRIPQISKLMVTHFTKAESIDAPPNHDHYALRCRYGGLHFPEGVVEHLLQATGPPS